MTVCQKVWFFISTVVLCGGGRFVATSHRFRPLLARFFVFSFFLILPGRVLSGLSLGD